MARASALHLAGATVVLIGLSSLLEGGLETGTIAGALASVLLVRILVGPRRDRSGAD